MKAKDNPFRVERVDALEFRLADESWDSLLQRLASFQFRAAVIGAHGSGKTTLLQTLTPKIEALGFRICHIRLSSTCHTFTTSQWQCIKELHAEDFLCLDGAEQLGPLQWKRVLWNTRRAGGLLITMHRAGRLPTLHQCETSPALLEDLISELQKENEYDVKVLFARHNGNIRNALRELYDRTNS